jgi:hypothetical protein
MGFGAGKYVHLRLPPTYITWQRGHSNTSRAHDLAKAPSAIPQPHTSNATAHAQRCCSALTSSFHRFRPHSGRALRDSPCSAPPPRPWQLSGALAPAPRQGRSRAGRKGAHMIAVGFAIETYGNHPYMSRKKPRHRIAADDLDSGRSATDMLRRSGVRPLHLHGATTPLAIEPPSGLAEAPRQLVAAATGRGCQHRWRCCARTPR